MSKEKIELGFPVPKYESGWVRFELSSVFNILNINICVETGGCVCVGGGEGGGGGGGGEDRGRVMADPFGIPNIMYSENNNWQAQVDLLNELPHDKTNKMACAPSENSGQPGHPPSLISLRCALSG